jgi:hypothetical protein
MIKMLRRRLRENAPDAIRAAAPPARLQRAQDMLAEIWERAGERHPVWRLVEGLLKMALDRSATVPATNDRSSRSKPVDGGGVPA